MNPQPLTIEIRSLEVFAHHGLLPEEREVGQIFRFDLKLKLTECPACETDDIAGTVDYAAVADRIATVATRDTYQLLEKLAAVIADDILENFPAVEKVKIRAIKPAPPLAHAVDSVSVSLRRKRHGS